MRSEFLLMVFLLFLSATHITFADEVAQECSLSVSSCFSEVCDSKEQISIALRIREEFEKGYDRAEFLGGTSWLDEDGDCLNTRHEVLKETSLEPPYPESGCEVQFGLWHDPYNDKMFEEAGELDIDHIVPLKEAYESSARDWPLQKRQRFANDRRNLLAVWKSENRSKGAKEPPEWMP